MTEFVKRKIRNIDTTDVNTFFVLLLLSVKASEQEIRDRLRSDMDN